MYHHGLGEQWIYLIMLTYTYICIYKLYLYRSIHIYCLGTKHTHLHVRQSEVMIPAVVGPPRSGMSERQAGWVQGSGARKRSLDGKSWFPPLWGVYYPCCKERGSPHGVIVVEYYLFLNNIIDVEVPALSWFSLGLFCMYIKNGYSVRGGVW